MRNLLFLILLLSLAAPSVRPPRAATPAPAGGPAATPASAGGPAATPAKYAGTYKIASWRSLEGKGMYHFFYLQPGGAFLLGAEWPGRESSRAGGTWSVAADLLSLHGRVRVSTNKGSWQVPFDRDFHILIEPEGIRLKPVPRKNRFGLLGWPNSFYFHRTRIAPNLPTGDIPSDPGKVSAMIENLRKP